MPTKIWGTDLRSLNALQHSSIDATQLTFLHPDRAIFLMA